MFSPFSASPRLPYFFVSIHSKEGRIGALVSTDFERLGEKQEDGKQLKGIETGRGLAERMGKFNV